MQETRLFFSNVPFASSKQDLLDKFSSAGRVLDLHLCTHRKAGITKGGVEYEIGDPAGAGGREHAAGESRGFGFVEMETVAEAIRVIDLFDGDCIGDRRIHVAEAQERVARA